MHIESVTLRNFRCFGDEPEKIEFEPDLTAFIGNNGSGKTAACQALQRVFGISAEERSVRLDDFHVPPDGSGDEEVTTRSMSIEVVLAFPELDSEDGDRRFVPEFFRRMAADDEGNLKCRIVLESSWTADSTVDGAIETSLMAVTSFADTYDSDDEHRFSPAERSRVQFVYVPASRDGARQVTAFLRGRLWRAARWSNDLRDLVREMSADVGKKFHEEKATQSVETAFGERWQQLHGAGTHSTLRFQPLEPDIDQFLRGAELTFEPDPMKTARPARLLSDGQRSLLHLALTTASLDLESEIANDPENDSFDSAATNLPALTVLAVEEPENNLSPFYLSRIVSQLLELGAGSRVQVLLSTHSASALGRVDPGAVRYFRLDGGTGGVSVRAITLPLDGSVAGTYVREAVRAHPELYFARFVLLGEGDSEQVVLPAIARGLGFDLDPSFVAMVPLGGRHTQHFWRLLTDLGIPHATLLDLDHGRAGGGAGRFRNACKLLAEFGHDVIPALDGFASVEDISDDLAIQYLRPVRDKLREHGVFFSALLDLDMLMLDHYWDAYTSLDDGERGPQNSDATESVIGTGGTSRGRKYWNPTNKQDSEEKQELLRWYRYLFSNRSKPATHLRALSQLQEGALADPPPVLKALVEFVRERVQP
ncbi:ATP-dependent nuclease [Pseudarthrobacter sp. O4]|uniref:ATP-dependent nuclease n=1 Tax=Pseudarthrobacter sp. O4 TaxID=3418417 RepID=UPI003CF26661